MKTLFSILFLFFFKSSVGQNKSISGVFSSTGDTTFWYKVQLENLKKLSLPSLDTASFNLYFRVWTNKQVICIWQNKSSSFNGVLITWVDEYVPNNEEPTNRSYIQRKNLNDSTVNLIKDLIYKSDIQNLPTSDSIPGWKNGLDGITYIIEVSTMDSYNLKTYWTPQSEGSLKQAKQVQKFIDNIFKLTNAAQVLNEFTNTIPFECYSNGGPSIVCKVLTNQERKNYLKERKNYRQH